jgi:flagellar basal-body rod protein FlgB
VRQGIRHAAILPQSAAPERLISDRRCPPGGNICRQAGKSPSAGVTDHGRGLAGGLFEFWHAYCFISTHQALGEAIMVSKLDRTLNVQQQALTLRAHRQQVLAGNIANADTPNYQARDFDFAAALQGALAGRSEGSEGGLRLATTSHRHLPGELETSPVRLSYRQPTQPSADGNTVDMDVERAQLAENAFYYEAGLTFISGRIKTMMTALQGQ